MSEVTIKEIASLREETGLGLMEVKKALVEAGGDQAKAIEILKKSGSLKAAKKSERASNNGIIEAYVHGEGRIGVIVEVSCETDFVAKNQEFKNLAHEIALQIAAVSPLYVSSDQVPSKELEEEKKTILEDLAGSGKPQEVIDKIVEGKLQKHFSEVCLLDQAYIKEPEITVKQFIDQAIAKIGENITVKRFARFIVGC